ncbi:hypothetical protein D3C81_1750160 [compost metagenome]
MPVIGVAAANAGQVRAGTLGTPEERVVPDAFTGYRVVAITLGLGTERPDHLRVALHAAFTDVDVAAFQLQRGVGLHALDRLVGDVLEEQRDDLGQAADADGKHHQQHQQEDVLLDYFVFHQGLLRPAARRQGRSRPPGHARCARCCTPSAACR